MHRNFVMLFSMGVIIDDVIFFNVTPRLCRIHNVATNMDNVYVKINSYLNKSFSDLLKVPIKKGEHRPLLQIRMRINV